MENFGTKVAINRDPGAPSFDIADCLGGYGCWGRLNWPHHWATAIALAIATVVFGVLLVDSFKYADRLLLRVQIIEQSRPPFP